MNCKATSIRVYVPFGLNKITTIIRGRKLCLANILRAHVQACWHSDHAHNY